MRIGLISCTKKKQTNPCPAKQMYQPSSLFKKAWNYAENHYDKIFILSAKYGLLSPDTVIESYNETLNNKTKLERFGWAKKVFDKLYFKLEKNDEVFIHAGVKYREFLEKWFEGNNITYHVPLRGLGIGQQLAWYSQFLTNGEDSSV